ncbi:fumarylacetoacetate hydrolase family protein [Endozoicomonas sp. G2_1]|uniref:fumarylacetoacetate hydrolase family protein n=1 Tax=Endozoicomonas sp. G2_1 TaxID=2821091 RepID=UPI001AD98035|nr:fumarylacetoacetate hydrolase family protein [Endozoicomonas sp. G2_1]MBO9489871.1 fumarylacetoacetate hydrolase family protein [Endozoicomonas sp. G2_1]
MPCHIARYRDKATQKFGWALVSNGFYAIETNSQDTQSFINNCRALAFEKADNLSSYQAQKLDEQSIELLSPITKPCRILCQGSNYPAARIETGADPDSKEFNTLFHKSDASITGPNADIVKPSCVRLLDYEIELALVIGRNITESVNVTEQNLHQFIAGIVMVHDVTARDIQIPQVQFYKGKSYRTFCPTGPYLCLLKEHEIKYLSELNLQLSVNGQVKQIDHTSNMIYKPHETLTELSQIEDLAPGDMVFTGSPGGCALSVPPAPVVKLLGLLPESLKWKLFVKKQAKNNDYLQSGDKIEASIKSDDGKIDLGIQRNTIVNQ